MNQNEDIFKDENSITNSNTYIIDETPITFSKLECIVSVISLILGFLFIRFAVVNILGYLTTLVYMLILTISLIFIKHNGYKISKKNLIECIILYVFSLVFSITANTWIKFLTSVFLILETTYINYRICSEQDNPPKFYFFAQMKALFSYPFRNFGKCPKAVGQSVLKGNIGSNLKFIIVGLLITTPLTFIVSGLLMSADSGVEKILNNIFNGMFKSLDISLIFQIIFGFLVGCIIFSMLYSNTHKDTIQPYNDTTYEIKMNNARFCPSMVVYTALTPIYILYIIYIISQIGYFINAFSGNLYDGYTYSEYARRGFFELSVIACINLSVILIANTFCKRSGNSYNDDKPLPLKIYNVVLCVFTIFIIATSISKMFLYMSEYGLTRLRIYTSWFMILLSIVFIILTIKEFKSFNATMIIKSIFILTFGFLCFIRVDNVIVKTNIELYQSGKIQDLDIYSLTNLSDDALPAIIEYINSNDDDNNNTPYDLKYRYQYLKDSINKYEKYNLSTMNFLKTYEQYYS